jgi:hypothetical protein
MIDAEEAEEANMKRIFEVAFTVAFVVGVLVSSAENTTLAQVGQLYDTPLFSVQYPPGAQVNLKDDRDQGDDSVTHFYRGRLPHHSWADVDVTEFSGAVLAEDHTEVMFSKSSAKMFDPGFQASPITRTTLGGLEGYKQTVRGHFSSNGLELPLVLRWRLAVSHDRTRVWILQTTSPTDQDLSEADCERIFDSLKIK